MMLKSLPHFFILKGCGIFYFLVFVLAGCGCEERIIKEARPLMNTFCEISCYDGDSHKTISAIDDAFKEMIRIEGVFSKFNENSETAKINTFAGFEKIAVSEEVFRLMERAVYYSRISEGAFDITVAPLMEIWGFVRRQKIVPEKEEIKNLLQAVGYKNIELDPKELSVKFLNKSVKIDFGGIAKGYAVDRARRILENSGIKNSLINLGGNMLASGFAPGNKKWNIGVVDPVNKGKLLRSFELTNQAISTSGNYERFFELDGKKYSHIINPLTGEPCQGIISVTVIAGSAEEADALSTAIFVMGEEKGINLAKSIEGIKVLILKEDGRLILY